MDKIRVIFFAAVIAISGPVMADPLKSVLEAFLVVEDVDAKGKKVERLEPVDAAEPGALLEYVLTYTNKSDEAL